MFHSVRTPAEQVLRLVLKSALLNGGEPALKPAPEMPRIGVKRVLPPYLGEMGYEVKFHLARVEPWLRNGWKILARRPEFYPLGTVVDAPEFFRECDAIMGELAIFGAGAGIYAPPVAMPELGLEPKLEGEALEVRLTLRDTSKLYRESMAEIRLRRLFLDWLDYAGRPLTDYDRNIFAFTETCVAETTIRRAEALRPSYLPPAFVNPSEPTEPHVGFQMRAMTGISTERNSDPEWMCATARAIGRHLGLPVIAYGRPGGCVIPDDMRTTSAEGGGLARELGYLRSCRVMLSPDSGWCDLMAWLRIPVLLEMLVYPTAFEDLRGSFQPRIAVVDRQAPLGPQVDAILAAQECLPTIDPNKHGTGKALFPWDY
jgi:hypothetical protein